ncbi:hypothetical protein [Actinacidiphila acidipaludis]|uniref:Uncharacterized protein n=1 Tax=Actinacidiphila acidipaludis TaxID=2873382 RepID=A0ABS7PZ27_9ACTN|nr:hypothetical protein [Streptomyces acidipaludis]MBY8876118.1 hypothetical protein [Streptomyces acidipaludis]
MHRSDGGERARALLRATEETLRRSFRECPEPVYRLRTPWLGPCTLAEGHTVDDVLQALTLAYGSWDADQPHIKVTTWWDLPGQGFIPDLPAGLDSAQPEDVTADLAGAAVPGVLRRSADVWLVRVDLGRLHVLASGRGPLGDLSFEPLTDLDEVLDARRAYMASRYPWA